MSTTPRIASLLSVWIAAPLLLLGCAEGSDEQRIESEEKITANHHLVWFRSLPGLGTSPVDPDAVFSGHGRLSMADDSTYRLDVGTSPGTPNPYALEATGELALYVPGVGREAGVILRGGYRLVGDDPDLFFTDRVSNTSSASIGLYYGTRVTPGQVEFEGPWHLLGMRAMFGSSGLTSARSVARAVFGDVSAAAGPPGSSRNLVGDGKESGSDSNPIDITFGGSIQNVLDTSNVGDGTSLLTVDYTSGGQTQSRVFQAYAGTDLVLAVDEDEADDDSGMLFLVRKFDAPAEVADPTQVAGEFLVGGHTFFVDPLNSGSDTFIGTLTISPQGAVVLEAIGHQGVDFRYQGTCTIEDDGELVLSVDGTNETWRGAINRSYDTLVIVDNMVEDRVSGNPELNLLMGVRKDTPTPP